MDMSVVLIAVMVHRRLSMSKLNLHILSMYAKFFVYQIDLNTAVWKKA